MTEHEEKKMNSKETGPSASCPSLCYGGLTSQRCDTHSYPRSRQDLSDAILKFESINGRKPAVMHVPTVMWADWCCQRYFVDVNPNEPFLDMRLVMFADQFHLD